ncbi:bifunctional diguanylate cyclase/phosphodiesterase [Litchfieldella anticariensis]|uniref:bifunctional diguanylate cyclase/phosphodiesterase n=1 Tax=Litchfieldella anticariensis TaxID=258591 RepID=UPI000398FCED|nr:EAL domain-containing protein [Halomonas anticariensis]
MTAVTRQPILSLKWRAFAVTSLLLLGLASLLTFLSHQNLTQQLDSNRTLNYERHLREIQQILQDSSDSLRLLAGVVASSAELSEALVAQNGGGIANALDTQWPTLQLDAGLDEVIVYDATRQTYHRWGSNVNDDRRPLDEWVETVLQNEIPLLTMRCVRTCHQYAAVPILVEGESVGVVLISRSLADVMRNVQHISGSNLALFISGDIPRENINPERQISDWGGWLVAITQAERSLPVFREASASLPLSHLVRAPQQVTYENRYYEVAAIDIEQDSNQAQHAFFLLKTDITEQVQAIAENTRTILMYALGGWLAAELLLLGILWGPMARLRRLAQVLPALASGKYGLVRQTIIPPTRRLQDEIDILDGTTLGLTDQLEFLHEEVEARQQELATRLQELKSERDFIGSLLDTAQVFILTQDPHGRITMFNRYAELAMGSAGSLLGLRFDDIFKRAPYDSLAHSTSSQDERTLQVNGEEQRTTIWYHTPLPSRDTQSPSFISVGLDITERKQAEERLAWLAHRDPLTNLYNRRFFEDAVRSSLSNDSHGAILFLDLDQFRDVNELSGHHVGDQLLRLVGDVLHSAFTDRCIVTRLGGDEFALLLESYSEPQAIEVADRIEYLLKDISLSVGGRRHRAIASIGIAMYPLHGDTPAKVMASADFAMYQAKSKSGQRWHLLSVTASRKEELKQRVYWVERLRDALDNDSFVLMAQPIVCLEDNSISHYEVLVRLRGEDGQLVTPGNFIPVAERSGQIVALDRWVLKHSLMALKQLQQRGIHLAVNLSGPSLHDENLKSFLEQELANSGAWPDYLILEVTETAAVTDFATAQQILKTIRGLGCQVALDDFGAGFSSFHYLAQLPADFIKIDGSFIRKLLDSQEDQMIVRAIADIAAGFGKKSIAEFVERKEILAVLQEFGINYAQGYYLGSPTPMTELLSSTPTST